LELSQINKYDTFINKGKGYDPGPGYKQIKVHFVYAIKHDGQHKCNQAIKQTSKQLILGKTLQGVEGYFYTGLA
jgi:hypothetical protein